MKKIITALFMNKWISTVTAIFIILCLASLLVPILPFKWWYAIVWLIIRFAFILLILWWVVSDEAYYTWLYAISNDKNKKLLIELKKAWQEST